jgi:hypothetical protein
MSGETQNSLFDTTPVLFDARFMADHAGRIINEPRIAVVELVANAYDAGATKVEIAWPDKTGEQFSLTDNGTGMSKEQFSHRWRSLNYDRLQHQGKWVIFPPEVKGLHRTPFGQSGKGRWAPFCFDESYMVTTWQNGQGFRAEVSMAATGTAPFNIIEHEVFDSPGHGTTISAFVRRNDISPDEIAQLIGGKFLIDPSFEIFVNGSKVQLLDLDGLETQEIEIPPHGKVTVHFIDTTEYSRTTKLRGITWWKNGRMIGEPSWNRLDDDGAYLLSIAEIAQASNGQFCPLEEGSHQPRLLSKPPQSQVELIQVQAGQVPQLYFLEVAPQPFDGIQVRCVRRQSLHANGPFRLGHELAHLGPAVDRRAVPDHQQPIPGQPPQVQEEFDRVQAVQRRRACQGVDLARPSQAAHDREMVPRLPLAEHGGSCPRGVGLDHTREQVEPRFVHENKPPALAAGLTPQGGPRLGTPSRDRLLVPLDRAGDRDLGRPADVLQESRDLALAVRDAEFLADHPGDPATGPDVAPESIRLGAMPEEIRDQPDLLGAQPGGDAPAVEMGGEGFTPTPPCGCKPSADRPFRRSESGGDTALSPTLLMEF